MPLAELDARAHEMPALVDEAASEVEAAVAAAPAPPKRPSESETDFDLDVYNEVVEGSFQAMLDSTKPAIERARALSVEGVGEALAIAALKTASLSAVGAGLELEDLIQILTTEFREIRERAGRSALVSHDRLH